jgi:hypothetical protein
MDRPSGTRSRFWSENVISDKKNGFLQLKQPFWSKMTFSDQNLDWHPDGPSMKGRIISTFSPKHTKKLRGEADFEFFLPNFAEGDGF